MHQRFAPRHHRFLYRIFMFAFDLDELPELHRRLALFSLNRANVFSFRESDFLPTAEPLYNASSSKSGTRNPETRNLKSRVLSLLANHGVDLDGGRVVLVTLPRVFGYLFNPVSFYFCYDRSGVCVASLAEVTNTFKEMKPYFLGPETKSPAPEFDRPKLDRPNYTLPSSASAAACFHLRTPKYFYVSPFSDVDVAFDFTLRAPADRLSIQIDDYVGAQRTLTSTLAGPRRELNGLRLAWFTLKYPLITLRIIALIHWHASLLWLRRLPWFAKSARASDQRDLYRPHSSITPPVQRVAAEISNSTEAV